MKNVTKLVMTLLVLSMAFVMTPQARSQTVLLTESWENGGAIPANWNTAIVSGSTNGITFVTTSSSPTATAYNGSYFVRYNSYSIFSGSTRLFRTAGTSTAGYAGASVDFAFYHDLGYSGAPDNVAVQYSINGGTTWTTAGSAINRYDGSTGWKIHTVALPSEAGNQADLRIAFLFTSYYGNNCYLDFAHLNGIALGTLSGTVTNATGGAPIANAAVVVNALPPVYTNAAGFYSIPNLNAGTVNVTCTAAGFVAYTGTATIVGGSTTTLNIAMLLSPQVGGIVTDASTGNPVVGATITIGSGGNAVTTLSVAGGVYLTPGLPIVGAQPIVIGKTGFDDFTATVTLVPNTTTTQDAALLPTAVQPGPFTAVLNNPTNPTAVNLNWTTPQGLYQLLYDDGIQDNFAIWATSTNLNALKFTPLGWPAKLIGGRVYLGNASNYAGGVPPSTNFWMLACKADGPGGVPGTVIDSVEVTPTGFGWANFSFATPLTITSGDFFLVMKQGGTPPDAAGIGVDLTNTSLRSYSKFVVGGAPWIPAAGTFMMRAIMQGVGGPLLTDNNPTGEKELITAGSVNGLIYEQPVSTVSGYESTARTEPFAFSGSTGNNDAPGAMSYQVWRLKQGQEGNQTLWTSIWTGSTTSTVDNNWPSLPSGPYRWAVKAIYSPPGQRPSAPTFSNVIGKGWTANVNVCVSLTCSVNPKAGTTVKMINADYPDTVYTKVTDTSGCVHFTNLWKGNYHLQASRLSYPVYNQDVTIMADASFNIMMLQIAKPVTNLTVDGQTLHSTWSAPRGTEIHLDEKFTTGGFTTNQWVVTGGSNWQISNSVGNGPPSAMFNWTPTVTNYNHYLTSKAFNGVHAPTVRLKYDMYLNNYSTASNEQMSVEVWNGTSWVVLKTYSNQGGSIPWTSEDLDISSITDVAGFKVRFHTFGPNSFNINNWNVDNIFIFSTDGTVGPNPCVIGYNYYLNGVLDAFTTDTTYNIPPSHVVYGTTYNACVKAVFGSGYSAETCVSFVSKFLCPPTELAGTGFDATAYLTWTKPNCAGGGGCQLMTFVYDDGVFDDGVSINPGYNIKMGNFFPLDPAMSGVMKSFDMFFTQANTSTAQNCVMYFYDAAENLIGTSPTFTNPAATYPSGSWVTVEVPDIPFTGPFYALIDYYVPSAPIKNYFCHDDHTVQVLPSGLAWTWYDGAFGSASSVFGYAPPVTFLHRFTGCINTDNPGGKMVTIDPANMPASKNVAQITNATSSLSSVLDGKISGQAGTPKAPADNPTLLGYNIYRDGVQVGYVGDPNILEFYDNNLLPGTYSYGVTGYYDVSPIPPLNDNSLPAGPVDVVINYGHPLPFLEPWSNGTWSFNNWTPSGNWSVNTAFGNEAPCADFSWQPAVTGYSQALTSTVINAASYTCAKIWLDFDLKLIDRNATGNEKLVVDVYYSNSWHQKLEVTNNGTTGWVLQHIDISSVAGKSFQIRFVATGENSIDILHWYVDNIHAYAVCNPAEDLTYNQSHNTVNLSWTPPTCTGGGGGGHGIHEGFEGALWPPQYFTLIQTNTTTGTVNGYWWQFEGNSAISPAFGSYFACVWWDYYHQDEWLIAHDAYVTTPLTFWAWDGPQGSPYLDHYYTKISTDQGATWTIINDMSTWPTGSDTWALYTLDMSAYMGQTVDIAWQAVDGDGQGLWFAWGIDDINIGAKHYDGRDLVHVSKSAGAPGAAKSDKVDRNSLIPFERKPFTQTVDAPSSTSLQGYNVWRTGATGVDPFVKLNASVVTDTTYTDVITLTDWGTYKYFVTSVFNDLSTNTFLCESPGSDTVTVQFPAVGIAEPGIGHISVFPNPANELVNIRSDYSISNVEVMNFVGQTVYTVNGIDTKAARLNTATFKAGVYFVKVSTSEGVRTVKITVTH